MRQLGLYIADIQSIPLVYTTSYGAKWYEVFVMARCRIQPPNQLFLASFLSSFLHSPIHSIIQSINQSMVWIPTQLYTGSIVTHHTRQVTDRIMALPTVTACSAFTTVLATHALTVSTNASTATGVRITIADDHVERTDQCAKVWKRQCRCRCFAYW